MKSTLFILSAIFVITNFIHADAELVLTHFKGPIYICEDHYYARENSVVYIEDDTVFVIGATWTPETARLLHEEIKKITDAQVTTVVNTNYHPDRAGGNAYWKSIGCEIHSTQLTYDLLQSEWEEICKWTRNGLPSYPESVALALPTHSHESDFDLHGGNIKVLYFGPAHTTDGVLVYFPNEQTLYGGCTLKPFLGNLEQADINAYPITLENIKASQLDISHIIAGHGRSIHGFGLIDRYLSLLGNKKNSKKTSE